jgi:hypothetical protein
VRTFTLVGDTMSLGLKMDPGIYTWQRISR